MHTKFAHAKKEKGKNAGEGRIGGQFSMGLQSPQKLLLK